MKHILIIDDDIYINDMLDKILTQNGYRVSHAYSGTEAVLFLKGSTPDLILLDLMLPGLSGEEVLPFLNDIPVIVMSAKVDVKDKVKLLLNGAADYITKPFEIDELLARIIVQLRKQTTMIKTETIAYRDILMNISTHEVKVKEQAMRLTKTEFSILKLLMENPHQVITKSILLDRINEETQDGAESALRVHISNLKRKLREVSNAEYIESVWGIGFKMAELPEQTESEFF